MTYYSMRLALWFLRGYRSRPHNFMGAVYIINPAEHTAPSLFIPMTVIQLWKYYNSANNIFESTWCNSCLLTGSQDLLNKSESTKTISSIWVVLGQGVFLIDSKWTKKTPRSHCFDTALLCSLNNRYDKAFDSYSLCWFWAIKASLSRVKRHQLLCSI